MNRKLNPKPRSIILASSVVLVFASSSTEISLAGPRGSEMKVSASVRTPELIAVRVHHDMCPYCKKLRPEFSELTRKSNDDSVLFITLDLTSKASQRQAALLVGALGLDQLWTGDLSRIGTVTFVDGKTRKTVSSFRANGDQPLPAALDKAVKTIRGRG